MVGGHSQHPLSWKLMILNKNTERTVIKGRALITPQENYLTSQAKD